MGQSYSISLRIRCIDEAGATKALQDLLANAEEDHINYNVDKYVARGIDTNNFWSLLRIFLADHSPNMYSDKVENNFFIDYGDNPWHTISNCFDACYGWHEVMGNMFEAIYPFLADGSLFDIYPDDGCDHYDVQYGLLVNNGRISAKSLPKILNFKNA